MFSKSDEELEQIRARTAKYKEIISKSDYRVGKEAANELLNSTIKRNLDLGTIEGNKNSKLAGILKEKINTKSNIPLNDADKELFSQLTGVFIPRDENGEVSLKKFGENRKLDAYTNLHAMEKEPDSIVKRIIIAIFAIAVLFWLIPQIFRFFIILSHMSFAEPMNSVTFLALSTFKGWVFV